jgi:hypothetical protein
VHRADRRQYRLRSQMAYRNDTVVMETTPAGRVAAALDGATA